jgi:magnesium chelatase subunit D
MSPVSDAAAVASLFAVDPFGLGGVCLRSQVHALRQPWLNVVRDLLSGAPMRRIPCNIADGRLLGGLDLEATLKLKRPVLQQGVLASSDGGVVVVSMAEQLSEHTAACLGAALDTGEVCVTREGLVGGFPARLGIVALDEGIEDEGIPSSLLDRLAFLVDFEALSHKADLLPQHEPAQVAAARRLLPSVRMDDDLLQRLCGTALALGVTSPRVAMLASRVARVAAALDGRKHVREDDAVVASRLVLAPRATQIPSQTSEAPSQTSETPAQEAQGREAPEERPVDQNTSDQASPADEPQGPRDADPTPAPAPEPDPTDALLAAAKAAIPAGLLMRLKASIAAGGGRSKSSGRFGQERRGAGRGRPAGVRSGTPRGSARLNVLETLRAAAPWQRLRGRELGGDERLRIQAGDCRVTLSKHRSRTLTVFAVDASGSSALHRLAEAKGAVELLLAECYLRRDRVAVISFRGRSAELVLPPTRSLVRAKRSLDGMPGGGATPLAAALCAAGVLADAAQRSGETVTLVMLSDGRANVGRDGNSGREAAHRDALTSARSVRSSNITSLFIDTSPRPNELAQSIATAMNARYVPLPYASSRALSDIVRAAALRT